MNSIKAQTIIKGPIYSDSSVSGTIIICPPPNKPILVHRGISISLYGYICNFYLAIQKLCFSNKAFLHQEIKLVPSGKITQQTQFSFCFQNIQLPYESYTGNRIIVKYGLRTKIKRRWASDKVHDIPIIIRHSGEKSEQKGEISHHLSFPGRFKVLIDFQKAAFDLSEIMKGTLKFQDMETIVKTVQVKIIRLERFLINNCPVVQDELISYEVMEQVKDGEKIEVRLCLKDVQGLTPSYEALGHYVAVDHQLKIVLGIEDGNVVIRRIPIKFFRFQSSN